MKTKSRIPAPTAALQPQTPALDLAPARPASQLVPLAAPVSSDQAAALVHAKPLPPPAQPRKARRHGRVAQLPKLQRDMVNRMLWNGVPYKNIVAALDESGYTLSERNISNWATGGYLEWRLEQEAVLENRLDQDHLLDFLRRDDAPELPEVGLQAAATRLSQIFLQKLAQADDPETHIDNYSKLIDLLCRLNREIVATQQARDDSRRSLGPEYNPAYVKDVEQLDAIENERFCSDPPADAELDKPSIPAFLPPIPTASILADQARQDRAENELDSLKHQAAIYKSLLCQKPSTPPTNGPSTPKPEILVPTDPPPASVPPVPDDAR